MTRWVFLTIVGFFATHLSLAQDVTGTWVGSAAGNSAGTMMRGRGRASRWMVNLSKGNHEELKGSIVDQGPAHLFTTLVSVTFVGSKLTFTFASPNGPISFVGTLSDDGNSIEGWLLDQPLTLKREGHAQAKTPQKPDLQPALAATPVSSTGTDAESSELLSRALAKLAGTGRRLLRYSCTETIERSYYSEPAERKLGPHALSEAPVQTCDGKEFGKDGRLSLYAEDRLRLAVAVADNKQIQSWAAASRFDSRSVGEIVPEGPMTTSASGLLLVDIFENPGTKFSYIGRKSEGARTVLEYAFDVPLAASHSQVSVGTNWKMTPYHGSFEIDAGSAELVRLTSESDPLPVDTKMCRFKTDTGYHYVQIGTGQFLMPSRSTFDTLHPDGSEARSVTTFSACHEYAAESSVSFVEQEAATDASVPAKAAAALPPGLSLTVALMEPIDLRTAAAGDAVAGKVTKSVRAPGSNTILVDAGAIVHGRISQMQHRVTTSQFAFAILYETLEQRGTVSPISVALDRELKAEQVRAGNGFARRGSEFSLPAPSPADDAGSWFTASAASGGYVVPEGSESKWVTVTK